MSYSYVNESRGQVTADKLVKISAVILGGMWTALGAVWTFFKYVREHALAHRIALRISGKIVQRDSEFVLFGSAVIKNVGRSKVRMERRGSALIVNQEGIRNIRSGVLGPRLEDAILVTDVVPDHEFVVPGELIDHPFAVALGRLEKDVVAISVRIRIVGHHLEWNALERFYVEQTAVQPRVVPCPFE